MDAVTLLDMAQSCLHGDAPPCVCTCPLGLDIRALLEKLRTGAFSAAAKLYARQALFPGIVSHICGEACAVACVRGGQALAIRQLERFCWQQVRAGREQAYFIPPKHKRVLVAGGGLTGLGCAVKLAQRGYEVCLTESGSMLLEELHGDERLPDGVLQDELRKAEQTEYLQIRLGEQAQAQRTEEYDAVVDTVGAFGGAGLPLLFSAEALPDPIEALASGINLANAVEASIKTGKRAEPARRRNGCGFMPKHVQPAKPVHPANPQEWLGEEVQNEAGRCLMCTCSECMQHCPMLRWYKKQPQKAIQDVANTTFKTEITEKIALRQIMSCSQCGRCGAECPVGIDYRDIFLQSRRTMQREGELPMAHYGYWLDDMAFANGEAGIQVHSAEKAEYLYFPGCQMGASEPEYVRRSFAWLRSALGGRVDIMLHCCGAPAYWAGDESLHAGVLARITAHWRSLGRPVVVLACPTCQTVFERHLGEIPVVSLWEVMDGHYPVQSCAERGTVSVFDPCASRQNSGVQRSIRSLLAKCGYRLEELGETGCCSYGGLSAAGNSKLAAQIKQENAALGRRDYVTYCTNCRDILAQEGKTAYHILDILLFDNVRGGRQFPNMGARRENRRRLKRELMAEVYGMETDMAEEQYRSIRLNIPDDIRLKMDRELIHDDNLRMCIHHAETTGEKTLRKADGCFVCHLKQNYLTFWVVYRPEQGAYGIVNVYKHRMVIEGIQDG